MNHKQKIQLLVGAALAIGLLAWFLHGQNWSEIGAAFRRAAPLPLAGFVAATIFSYVMRAWRWQYLYRPLARVPYMDLLSATYVGFMSAQLVPRSGEVLRPYLIARKHPVSTSAGFATIILERLIDLITVVFLFALYLYVLPMPAQQVQGPILDLLKRGGLAGAAVGLVGVLVLFAFHAYPEKSLALADAVLKPLPVRVAHPFRQLLKSFGDGLAVLKAPLGLWAVIVAQSIILWLAIAGGFHLNNLAFGIDLPIHSTFLLIAFLTVGVAIPTPGNVGGFHGAYLMALHQAFGQPQETSMAAGISGHALSNLSILVIGLVFLAREGLTMSRVAELAGSREQTT